MRKYFKDGSTSKISQNWPHNSPGWSIRNLVWLSQPVVALTFTSNLGIVHEYSISEAVI